MYEWFDKFDFLPFLPKRETNLVYADIKIPAIFWTSQPVVLQYSI